MNKNDLQWYDAIFRRIVPEEVEDKGRFRGGGGGGGVRKQI